VLGLDVAVEVATVVDEFDYFYQIDQDALVGETDYVAFVSLHYKNVHLVHFVVQDSVDAWPLYFGDVLP
jgi:hypothetical protein